MSLGIFHHLLTTPKGFRQGYDYNNVPSGIVTDNKVPMDSAGMSCEMVAFTERNEHIDPVDMECSMVDFQEFTTDNLPEMYQGS